MRDKGAIEVSSRGLLKIEMRAAVRCLVVLARKAEVREFEVGRKALCWQRSFFWGFGWDREWERADAHEL